MADARASAGRLKYLCQSAVVLALTLSPMPSRAMPCASMALVLAIDASGSISDAEYALQIQSTARALRDPQVVAAMESVGGVAVAAVIWADTAFGVRPLPWVHVTDMVSADSFALILASQPRIITGNTDMGNGISAALDLLDDPRNCATYRVIDVSGDGRESIMTRSTAVSLRQAKARADATGVIINGLAVSINDPRLADYYLNHVIQGPGSFMIEVVSYEAFEQAMIQKLLREVGGYGAAMVAHSDKAIHDADIIQAALIPATSSGADGS